MKHKHLIALVMLVLASLACYSDSPLYPFELTAAPPTITPIPSARPDQSRFDVQDVALAPMSVTQASFRLDLTNAPEPLAANLSNRASTACSQNALLRILYRGVDPKGTIYVLVDCGGNVGWTREDKILGPLAVLPGDRALTTQAGANDFGQYKVEVSDPPYEEDNPFRQTQDCKINDTVEVVSLMGFSTGELYYKIRCTNPVNPVTPSLGWAPAEALFGPVRFRNGERGIVPAEFDTIDLSETPNGENVVGSCEGGTLIQITETPVERIEDELFYELDCGETVGWASQNLLVGPIPYDIGTTVLITAPGVVNSVTVGEANVTAVPPDATPTTDITPTPENPPEPQAEEVNTSVPITENPEPFLPDNQIGTCQDAVPTEILDYAGVEGRLYAQVRCDDITGWLDVERVYGPVEYEIGQTVILGEKALLGFNQRGIYLSVELFDIEGPSGGASVIAGECAFDFENMTPTEATLTDIGYYRSSTRQIVGVFYQAECQNEDGEAISGWINQDRIGE